VVQKRPHLVIAPKATHNHWNSSDLAQKKRTELRLLIKRWT
jgi:hypothetical protein